MRAGAVVVAAVAGLAGFALIVPAAGAVVLPSHARPLSSTKATLHAVVALAPTAPTVSTGATVTFDVRVTNPTSKVLSGGTVTLSQSTSILNSSSAVSSWLTTSAGGALPGRLLGTVAVPDVAPLGETHVSYTMSESRVVDSGTWGVRGIASSLKVSGSTISSARTSVVVTTGTSSRPISLASILPLVPASSALGLVTSGELTHETGAGGVLKTLLDDANNLPITMAVDPRLTTSIVALGSNGVSGPGEWLSSLDTYAGDSFWLTFGDSDVFGQLQAGAHQPVTPSLTDLSLDPSATTDSWPGFTPTLNNLVWARNNSVSSSSLNRFKTHNSSTLVLAESNVSGISTGTAHATVNGAPAVVVSTDASRCLALAETALTPFDSQVAQSCLVSTLAGIRSQSSNASTVVASFERSVPAAVTSGVLSSLYALLSNESWIKPVGLSKVLSTSPTSASLHSQAEAASRVSAIKTLLNRQKEIAAFSPVASKPEFVVNPGERRLAAALSNSWTATSWKKGLAINKNLTEQVLNGVSIVTSSTVNMVGGQVRIPVVIRNTLDSPVTVIIKAVPTNGRIVVNATTTATIEANTQNRAYIPVTARVGSGEVNLEISLTSADGSKVGVTKVLPVRVRADWEVWGLVVIGILFIALLIAGVIRTLRKRRRSK